VLSAHLSMEPANNPLATFGPCPTIPLATNALCFAFAAISALSRFFDDNE
jgi:hypothetical protein